MTAFIVGAPEFGETIEVSFGDFVELALGRTITSAADWGPDRFEVGLSGDVMLRVFHNPNGLVVNVISTLNSGETPTLLLRLPSDEPRLPARVVETRLRSLRQLYATVRLADLGRIEELKVLEYDANLDIEHLLPPDEHLRLESIGRGSWLVALWTKARESYKSLLKLVTVVYPRAREAMLSKLEADARLKQVEVEREEFKLLTSKVDYALGLAEKLPPGHARELVWERVEREVIGLLGPEAKSEAAGASVRLLGPKVQVRSAGG